MYKKLILYEIKHSFPKIIGKECVFYGNYLGSLSIAIVLLKSYVRKCFGISFFALLNDFTDVLLNQDTHPEMTKSPKSKSNSFDYFDEVILSLQFSV